MRCAQDFMVEVPVLKLTDQITKARQILRDLRFREVYVTDARKVLLGYVDITDALRVTATKSNVTLEGYIKDAAHVSGDAEVEKVAKHLREFRTDSVAIVNGQEHIAGGVLLSAVFPVIISRNELRGLVSDHMTKKVVTATPDEPLQKIYSMIVESGFTAFPVVKKQKLVGLASRRDLISSHRIRTGIAQNNHATIEDVMVKEIITIAPDEYISTAAELMVKHDVSRLPVIDGTGLVGIVDRHDVLAGMV